MLPCHNETKDDDDEEEEERRMLVDTLAVVSSIYCVVGVYSIFSFKSLK
jgi:hypothetical protein